MGKNPKTNPKAARISADFNRALASAVEKEATAQKRKGNLEGTFINTKLLLSFLLLFLKIFSTLPNEPNVCK